MWRDKRQVLKMNGPGATRFLPTKKFACPKKLRLAGDEREYRFLRV
jgi:hypothetical protein